MTRNLAQKEKPSEGIVGGLIVQPSEGLDMANLKTEMPNVVFRIGNESYGALASRQKKDYDAEKFANSRECDVVEEQQRGIDSLRTSSLRFTPQCSNCRRKDRSIMDLQETLQEKDFFFMTMIEDAHFERQEKEELRLELISSKAAVVNLKQRLAQEVEEREADYERNSEEMSRLKDKLREVEIDLELAFAQKLLLKKELESYSRASRRRNILNRRLRREMSSLQLSQNKMLSAILKKVRRASEENGPGLARKSVEKQGLRIREKKRSRSATEEGTFRRNHPSTVNQIDGASAGSVVATPSYEGLVHISEIERIRFRYIREIKQLEIQVKCLQEKVRILESSISKPLNDEQKKLTESGNHKDMERGSSVEKSAEASELNDTRNLRGGRMLRLPLRTDQALTQYSSRGLDEKEVDKWKKLYMAAKLTVDSLQNDYCRNAFASILSPRVYSQAPKDPVDDSETVQNWLRVLRSQQEAEAEQRLLNERISMERRSRAKDERLEALRQQLLRMEKEANQNQKEIVMLREKLKLVSKDD